MSFLVYPPPRYHGRHGLVSARYRPVDTAPDLVSGGGNADDVTGASAQQRAHYLATGASTGGEFGLYRLDMPPHGMGPKTHFHRTMSESFFILSGSVALYDGERWIDSAPGDFLHVPIGGLHAFHNAGDEPASMLLLFTPGAPREPYFEGIAGLADMTDEERQDFFLRHDNHWV
jgi:mannose-6-phosphate isomerase-like protein (cupin superfamily)